MLMRKAFTYVQNWKMTSERMKKAMKKVSKEVMKLILGMFLNLTAITILKVIIKIVYITVFIGILTKVSFNLVTGASLRLYRLKYLTSEK